MCKPYIEPRKRLRGLDDVFN